MASAPKTFASAYDFALHLAQRMLPTRMTRYSGEDFDIEQAIAKALTDADRKRGRAAPQHGYSAEHVATAERALKDWRQSAWARAAA